MLDLPPAAQPPSLSLSDVELLCLRDQTLWQFEFARQYTLELVRATDRQRWYEIPSGSAASLAWLLGHIAVSEYGLLLFRQRGRADIDLELMPGVFRKRFGKGSNPATITADDFSADAIIQRMSAIHAEAMRFVANMDAQSLRDPIDMPYAVYPNKIGAILFAPLHEMLHAGQIGAWRRAIGLEPVR